MWFVAVWRIRRAVDFLHDTAEPGPPPDQAQAEPLRRPAGRRKRLISSAQVGLANRRRVLQTLFNLGPTSRAELARHAGVNRTTISGIVQPLVDGGILVEGDPLPVNGSGGKPGRPLWFAPDSQPLCAVLLLADQIRSGLVTMTGHLYAEVRLPLPPRAGPSRALADTIESCVAQTLAQAHRTPLGIGVAVSGMVDTDRQTIVTVNLCPALDGFPLGDVLQRRFGLPTFVDHHPRALLVGDRWFGRGRGLRQFAVIYAGEVLGGALYLDDHLYRGPAGAGGELGHTFVQVDGDVCTCGRRGCWETIATLGWLRREARKRGLAEPDGVNAARLVAMAAAGGPATGLLDTYARNLAVGIANLQQTMAPNFFILHGDVIDGGPVLIEAIARHLELLVPPRPGRTLELVAGDPEQQAALKGAAGLVLSEVLQLQLG